MGPDVHSAGTGWLARRRGGDGQRVVSSRDYGDSDAPDPIDSLSAFLTNFLDLSRSI